MDPAFLYEVPMVALAKGDGNKERSFNDRVVELIESTGSLHGHRVAWIFAEFGHFSGYPK